MMYVRKNVEAFGRFWASSVGIEPGLLTRPGSAAMIPDESVTTRNEFCEARCPLAFYARDTRPPTHAGRGGFGVEKERVRTTTWKIK